MSNCNNCRFSSRCMERSRGYPCKGYQRKQKGGNKYNQSNIKSAREE